MSGIKIFKKTVPPRPKLEEENLKVIHHLNWLLMVDTVEESGLSGQSFFRTTDLWPPLLRFAFEKNSNAVGHLVHTENIDEEVDGVTPLHLATYFNDAKTLKILLDAKADPNKKNKSGETPLMVAAARDFPQSVVMLLEAKAPIDEALSSGATPLFFAVQFQRLSTAALLIGQGANVNIQLKDGRTCLIQACADANFLLIDLLCAANANVNLRNSAGFAALDYVWPTQNLSSLNLLISSGAQAQEYTNPRLKEFFQQIGTILSLFFPKALVSLIQEYGQADFDNSVMAELNYWWHRAKMIMK